MDSRSGFSTETQRQTLHSRPGHHKAETPHRQWNIVTVNLVFKYCQLPGLRDNQTPAEGMKCKGWP